MLVSIVVSEKVPGQKIVTKNYEEEEKEEEEEEEEEQAQEQEEEKQEEQEEFRAFSTSF